MYIMFLMLTGAESCDVRNMSLSVHLSAGSLLCLVNTSSSSKQVKGTQCYVCTSLVTVFSYNL